MSVSVRAVIAFAALYIASCSASKVAKSPFDEDMFTELDTIEIIGSKSSGEYRATAERDFDLLHTTLEVQFDWEKQHLLGEAFLKLKPYFYSSSRLILDAKGFDLHKVGLLGSQRIKALDYTYDSLKIYIDLDKAYTRDESFELYIAYTAKPNDLVKGDASFAENKGLFFINPTGEDPNKPRQIWTQGETESSSCWFPTIDHPNERCTQEMYITVQNNYITFSNGKFVSSQYNDDGTRTDIWRQSLPHAPYLFAMTVGEYEVVRDYWRDIEVNYYVEPEYQAHAKAIFGNTPEMLELYSSLFGVDYPWEKYSQIVVRDFVAGAMENTSATIHFSGLHQTTRELLDDDYQDIIAHEVMHQWFGDLVTCESWSHISLNEAFATYGEYLWFEHKYGKDEADYRLNNDLDAYLAEAETKQEKLIRFYYDHEDELFDAHSYQKGGRVLHMLRNLVGDEAFFQALNLYLVDHAYEAVEIHHLRLAFEEVTGKDLNWFFDQWFFKAGHPVIDIAYSYSENGAVVTIDQKPSAENGVVYRLPLAIDVYTAAGRERHDVVLDQPTTVFTFKTDSRPFLVNVDAEKMLLCEKRDERELYEYVYLFNNARNFMDRYEAIDGIAYLEKDDAVVQETYEKALADPHWMIRNLALNYLHPDEGGDAVFSLIEKAAKTDSKSANRADALALLAESNAAENYEALIRSGLNDPSYKVMAASLRGLAEFDSDAALTKAEELEQEKNSEIVSAIASVYSTQGGSEYQDYFEQQIANSSGFSKYYLIYYYGGFLSRMEQAEIEKGLPTLRENAINDRSRWIRYAGKLSLENIQRSLEERQHNASKAMKKAEAKKDPDLASLRTDLERTESALEMVEDILKEVKESRKSQSHSTN